MKVADLRSHSVEELQRQLEDLLKEQFALRMQKGSGQLGRPSQFKMVRKDLARIRTVMAERRAGEQA